MPQARNATQRGESHAHGHGEPVVWDPSAGRTRRGWILVVLGLVLIGGGAALWMWRPAFEIPLPADYPNSDPDLAQVVDEPLARARAEPANAQAIGMLALAYEANKRWREAELCYARAAELDAATPMWPHHLAVAVLDSGDVERARTLLRGVAQRFPDYPPAHALLGELALEAGDLAEARRAFERVIASAPQSAEGHAGLADVSLREGDAGAAQAFAEKALALDPTYELPHHLLGRALAELGEDGRAKVELKLGENSARRRMGDTLSERIGEFAAKVEMQLDHAAALIGRKRPADAEALLRKIERRHPRDARVLSSLALAQLEQQRPEEALATLQRAVELAPDDAQVHLGLAACQLTLRRLRDAEASAKRAAELAPDSARARFLVSQALFGAGDREDALVWMEQACALVPEDPIYLSQLGALYRGLGKFEDAARVAERLTLLMPGRWEPWADLAQFRLSLDDVSGAQSAYENAMELTTDATPLAPLRDELARRTRN